MGKNHIFFFLLYEYYIQFYQHQLNGGCNLLYFQHQLDENTNSHIFRHRPKGTFNSLPCTTLPPCMVLKHQPEGGYKSLKLINESKQSLIYHCHNVSDHHLSLCLIHFSESQFINYNRHHLPLSCSTCSLDCHDAASTS